MSGAKHRSPAPHVAAAMARNGRSSPAAQPSAPAGPGGRALAPHVARALGLATPAAAPGTAQRTVLQRAADDRPRRSSAKYDTDFHALALGHLEATAGGKLKLFQELARTQIAKYFALGEDKRQPYRNTASGAARSESTNASLCARMDSRIVIATGSSGGNQHGEMRALDACGWKRGDPGNQYYFVCAEGKPSCYLCTAISALLGIAVATTDGEKYSEYVSPQCLQNDDVLWATFVGEEAYAAWLEISEGERNNLRKNLGWVKG